MKTTFQIIFLFLFVLFLVASGILEYHWRYQASRSKMLILARILYYGVSLVFLLFMGAAVTGIV